MLIHLSAVHTRAGANCSTLSGFNFNGVTGVATWHINADEPRFVDYNQEHNPDSMYQADPFRSSDHDPILIGIGK